ncbi:MAG: quinolinate synthase NadA [Butyricicoccus sp.]|nr:quinolinate synthase NadA [Butyricicoccus sp.]
MRGIERQTEILHILHRQNAPISAKRLAQRFHVSRQVIVQDIALLRARNYGILSTCRGYVIPSHQPKRSILTMHVHQLQEEILRLKQEKDICILAHAYQSQPILEVADYIGDSYGLSVQASKSTQQNIIMCGVRFMAETCKLLCPDKRVYLPNPVAGCPMAEQLDLEKLQELKKQYPNHTVVAYINTTASLKTACDVCVTSASAVEICKKIPNRQILFIPDPNLGSYVQKQIPDKEFILFDGGCPHHQQATKEDVERMKTRHPDAKLLVHPECAPEVTERGDYVGSTTAIMNYVGQSSAREFIIATENSITEHLQYQYPDKVFYPLTAKLTCPDMRITSLMDIYHCIQGTGGEEIQLADEVMEKASKCIEKMIALGK